MTIVEQSERWSEQETQDIAAFSLQHASRIYPEAEDLVDAADVVVIDFPGVTGINR